MSYRVRVSLGGIELELEGDREFVESRLTDLEWLDKLLEKAASRAALPAKSAKVVKSLGPKPPFNEFASEFSPKSHSQRILTIAYYLYKWEDRNFTYEDVEKLYEHARWPMPNNPWQTVSELIRKGFIEEADRLDGRKSFRILDKGIRFVESGFREE